MNTAVIGSILNQLQTWFNAQLTEKRGKLVKKEKNIKTAFLLSQNLKKWSESLSDTIKEAYFVNINISNQMSDTKYYDEAAIPELKYILIYMDAPSNIILGLDELKRDLSSGLAILAGAIDKIWISRNSTEYKYLKRYKDPYNAAAAYAKDYDKKIQDLINNIQHFLFSLKQ